MTTTAHAPPSRALMMLEARALSEFGAFCWLRPWLSLMPRGDGHPVLVLPGLMAGDLTTGPLRRFLADHGYAAYGWELGLNRGLRDGVETAMQRRVDALHARHDGRKVSLVGWSLGGLYARQLAKAAPDKVRCVISLGSPFAGAPVSTNAWRVYELASGTRIDDPTQVDRQMAEAPPVPTTSIFSRSDGVCAWQGCLNEEGPLAENIEVDASHCGLAHHPAAVYAIADRLAQPEGRWKKFDRGGLRALAYPDWRR